MINSYINGHRHGTFPLFKWSNGDGSNYLLRLLGVNLSLIGVENISFEPVYTPAISVSRGNGQLLLLFRRRDGLDLLSLSRRYPFIKREHVENELEAELG